MPLPDSADPTRLHPRDSQPHTLRLEPSLRWAILISLGLHALLAFLLMQAIPSSRHAMPIASSPPIELIVLTTPPPASIEPDLETEPALDLAEPDPAPLEPSTAEGELEPDRASISESIEQLQQ
ncbi:MAG: hypothetical protein AAGH65_12895, partial [Pseudomonadota bacterium]